MRLFIEMEPDAVIEDKMSKKDILITEKGLEKLNLELSDLINNRRPEVISRIKGAKELGDLSENAEYSAAKEEQSFIEGRIQEIEEIIKHAQVVEGASAHKDVIGIGSTVKVSVEGDIEEFDVVGQTESDPSSGKISVDSPVGKALLGQKVKDKVAVQTPDGKITYQIISVS